MKGGASPPPLCLCRLTCNRAPCGPSSVTRSRNPPPLPLGHRHATTLFGRCRAVRDLYAGAWTAGTCVGESRWGGPRGRWGGGQGASSGWATAARHHHPRRRVSVWLACDPRRQPWPAGLRPPVARVDRVGPMEWPVGSRSNSRLSTGVLTSRTKRWKHGGTVAAISVTSCAAYWTVFVSASGHIHQLYSNRRAGPRVCDQSGFKVSCETRFNTHSCRLFAATLLLRGGWRTPRATGASTAAP